MLIKKFYFELNLTLWSIRVILCNGQRFLKHNIKLDSSIEMNSH